MPDLSQARIGQIAVVCQDVARATAFYRDTLALKFLFAAGPNLAFFDCNGMRLMLTLPEGTDRQGSMFYFFVDDIDGTQRDLRAKGVKFMGEPHMIAEMPDHKLWLTAFHDSEGNMLGIFEERRS
jgi:predicted enzyme related to lactoylglutathione lyase